MAILRAGTLVLVTLLLQESCAVRYYTVKNYLCQTECAKNGKSYYWCWYDSWSWNWDYCSPHKNVDIYNKPCRSSHECGKHGSSRNWCYLDNNDNWEYCGTLRNNFELISTYGYFCKDECEQRGESYFWCHTDSLWGYDYCSPEVGRDRYHRLCDANSFCDKSGGTNYYWCYVNGWSNYCSIEGESKYLTSDGYYCANECRYDTSYKFFWCNKFDRSWNYCSPTQDIDAHGQVCDVSKCKATGAGSYQCSYGTNQWDACGIESLNENCAHRSSNEASETAIVQQTQQCVRSVNMNSNLEVRWYMEDNDRISRNNKTNTYGNQQAARSAIAQLNDIDRSEGTLVDGDGVRIDMQGSFTDRNGRRYANLQIQVNRLRNKAKDSTTIATALVETNERGNLELPIRYVRDALLRSLQDPQPRQCRLQRNQRS